MKTALLQKEKHLGQMADWREEKYRSPELRHLFLELTLRCNERCLHCGSSCGETAPGRPAATGGEPGNATGRPTEVTLETYKRLLDEVKEDFDIRRLQLCITGGEPLLRRDFFDIMAYAHSLGYTWGMTSNGTLITKEVARKLKETGMGTISVSLDGLRESHDAFRRTPGGFDRALEGINNLVDCGAFKNVQVTTVVHHGNIGELDSLFNILDRIDIDSWRIINMEPMGRALDHPELMMTDGDYRRMFGYIRLMRQKGYPVSYGCSHFLGLDYEREVRNWYYLCTAGIYIASIMANGDIAACLDIERRPETIQGNIYRGRFSDVWKNGFSFFRRDKAGLNEKCAACQDRRFCAGDSWHSWNFEENKPRVCFKGLLWQ